MGVVSVWRVRGRVTGVKREGDLSVWEGEAPSDVASIGSLSIGDEAGCLTAVVAVVAAAAVGVVGVVGVVVVTGSEVIAGWFVLAPDRGGLCPDVAVDREVSGDVCC